MPVATVEKIASATKDGVETLTECGNAAIAGFQELAKAYQELATKNAGKLTASIQTLAAVKSPTEFAEIQQKLIKEGVESAIADSQKIAELTAAVFNTAFTPVKKQFEVAQKAAKK